MVQFQKLPVVEIKNVYFFGSCVWFSVITSILQNASYRQRLFSASLRSLSTLPRQKGNRIAIGEINYQVEIQEPTNKVQNLLLKSNDIMKRVLFCTEFPGK